MTDLEKRIFLAAISREEKVCKELERELQEKGIGPGENDLIAVCQSIKRKVMKSDLWKDEE